jgi:hypothetical protein
MRARVAVIRRAALEHICNVNIITQKASVRQHFIKQLARSTHKRLTLRVFIFARRLANYHHPRLRIAAAKHNLRAPSAKLTVRTSAHLRAQRGQAASV